MNHFLAKFKCWIESDWVSATTTNLRGAIYHDGQDFDDGGDYGGSGSDDGSGNDCKDEVSGVRSSE